MTYRDTVSGMRFSGRTYAAVVARMRARAWLAPGKLAYMLEVRDRVRVIVPGASVDVTGAAEFLGSLVDAGLLTKEVN